MQLYIAPARLIGEVQIEFNREFPFLKLEFFRNHLTDNLDNTARPVMLPAMHISDCKTGVKEDHIEISGEMKVADLEKIFKGRFGLNVEVYRCSGNLWLQTTMTDSWTLQKQNEHGMEISRSAVVPLVKEDYRDTEAYD